MRRSVRILVLSAAIVAGGLALEVQPLHAVSVYPTPVFIGSPGAPDHVAVGDFDSDGLPDIAASAPEDRRIYIHYGRGDLTFVATRSINVDGIPAGLAAADFDGDGRTDLAWADVQGGAIGIVYQVATTPVTYRRELFAAPDETAHVCAFDVDGDGWIDVVATHEGADAMSWMRNSGPSFSGPSVVRAGDGPTRLVPLRGRGEPVFAVVQSGVLSGDVAIQDPRIDGARARVALTDPAGLLASDLTDDGVDELIVVQRAIGRVSVLEEGPPGSFEEIIAAEVEPGATAVRLIEGASVDPEFLVCESSRLRLTRFRSQVGSYQPIGSWFLGDQVEDFLAADFDGDGIDEYVAALPAVDGVQVIERRGDILLAPEAVRAGETPLRVTNLGGRVAVLAPGSAEVLIYGLAGGELVRETSLACDPLGVELLLADLDGVGGLDLVTLVERVGFDVYLDGAGGWQPPVRYAFGGITWGVAALDIGNDNDLDLVVTDQTDMQVRVYLGDGSGAFTETAPLPTDIVPRLVATADLDRNGLDDFVLVGEAVGLRLYFQQATGFEDPTPFELGRDTRDVAFGFFNSDEFPDIVLANAGNSSFDVLMSTFAGVYSPTIKGQLTPDGAQNVTVLDFDLNGFDDLFFSSPTSPYLTYHANQGSAPGSSGNFSLPLRTRGGVRPIDTVGADLDGDPTEDLLVLDAVGGILILLRSDPLFALPEVQVTGQATIDGGRVVVDLRGDAVDASLFEVRRWSDGSRLAVDAIGPGHWRAEDEVEDLSLARYRVLDRRGSVIAQLDATAAATGVEGFAERFLPVVYDSGSIELRLRASGSLRPDLRVYDLRGRRVAELSVTGSGDGWFLARWTGDDDRGRPVSRGRYLVEARTASGRLRTSVLVSD